MQNDLATFDPLPDAAFEELADELFQSYDAAEAADATPPGEPG